MHINLDNLQADKLKVNTGDRKRSISCIDLFKVT